MKGELNSASVYSKHMVVALGECVSSEDESSELEPSLVPDPPLVPEPGIESEPVLEKGKGNEDVNTSEPVPGLEKENSKRKLSDLDPDDLEQPPASRIKQDSSQVFPTDFDPSDYYDEF